MRLIRVFSIFSLMLCANVSLLFAKAPTTPKILFTSSRSFDGNYEVYMMNPDGSEQANLTQHRANDVGAVWSPTGEKILFLSDRGGLRDLYLMNPDGTNVRRFFKRKTKNDRGIATWSPDGTQIAYGLKDWDKLKFTIHIATLGEQEEELVVKGFNSAWSPDGKEIAYITYIIGNFHRRLTLIDIHTREPKRLLPKKAIPWQNNPSWSATGDKLVFSWNQNPLPPDHKLDEAFPPEWKAKQTIYIINRDGTEIAFMSKMHDDEKGTHIRIINIHTKEKRWLLPDGEPTQYFPAWSPTSEKLAFSLENPGLEVETLFIANRDGTDLQKVLPLAYSPCWSPRGDELLFKRAQQIYKMRIGDDEPKQLTFHIETWFMDWFDPAYALPVSPKPHLLTTTWGRLKRE